MILLIKILLNLQKHFFRWSFARRLINLYDDVLEIGCGTDVPLSQILTKGSGQLVNTYYEVDIRPLPKTDAVYLTYKGEFNFVERWREIKEKFTVVVHLEVIEHMRETFADEMLLGCYSLLNDNGTMIMSTPVYNGKRQNAGHHVHEYTITEMQEKLKRAGFKVIQRFGTYMNIRKMKRLVDPIMLERLSAYFDNDALSCIFASMFPNDSQNNLWVCEKS